jgi:enamine deaminase RidA (YjgF/YER057c/UK114 family)
LLKHGITNSSDIAAGRCYLYLGTSYKRQFAGGHTWYTTTTGCNFETFLGMGKQDVVQLKAYLNNTADISIVEKELAAYFPANAIPPIVYVEWISKEYEIEIELIAASPATTTTRDSAITFLDLPKMVHSPLYSKAVQVNKGKKIYFSTLYGTTPDNAQAQTEELFGSLKKLLKATGSDFTHLVKATYFHYDVAGSALLWVLSGQNTTIHTAHLLLQKRN